MATTGHELELINVEDLKAALQKYKTTVSDTKLSASLKGVANGLAELDSNGKVPSSQLPSYVDDVIEGYYYNGKFYNESAHTTEITGEGGKIYVDLATEKTYRYSGSTYAQVKGDIVVGTSTGTAADGGIVNDHINDSVIHITAAERTAWNAKGSYSKPAGGIPKSDLSSDVQSSLDKADTALQEHQDISGKADKSSTVSSVDYDTTNKKITQTINNVTTDVVTASTIVTDGGGIKSHQTIKQDGITGATINRFGVCDSVASTSAKVASITTGTFNLEAGTQVSIKFSNTNSANSPTLNVNSKGAKNIFHNGVQITTGDNKALLTGVCDFVYDGTQWHLIGNYIDVQAVSSVVGQTGVVTTAQVASALETAGYELTDTKVTSVDNHYTPTDGENLTTTQGSAAAATAGQSYDVVTGVTIAADAAGHITSVSTTRQKVVSSVTVDISGKQDRVPKLGSTTKPVYTSAAGTFAECSTYAGGTAVTLNGSDKGGNTASFYAPTAVGTSGQVLMSSGSGAPSWGNVASTTTCQDIVTELT